MSSLLFVEAFGQLRRAVNSEGIVSEDEEDLYSVFRARSELMGWSANSAGRRQLERLAKNCPSVGWTWS